MHRKTYLCVIQTGFMQKLIEKFIDRPGQLLLIDGSGALISAFFLGFVLVRLQGFIGMPVDILYILATLAGFYALYSFGCHFLPIKIRPVHLRIIALANILHCLLTAFLLVEYHPQITDLGRLYFFGEIAVVLVLAYLELKTARHQ